LFTSKEILGGNTMGYRNANEILPKELLNRIKQYVEGGYLYIPISKDKRKQWGTNTSSKEFVIHRNKEIYSKYTSGMSTKQLAKEYYLAQKTIQKIIRETKKCQLSL
jgi:Mor family transcriptional regulator